MKLLQNLTKYLHILNSLKFLISVYYFVILTLFATSYIKSDSDCDLLKFATKLTQYLELFECLSFFKWQSSFA